MFDYVDINSSLDKGRNSVLQLTLCRTFDSMQQHNDITTFTHGERQAFMLIKRSNLMQQYADIYLLQSHSTCFGRYNTHHQEY